MPAGLTAYLDVITGRGEGEGWIEVRRRYAGGMRTRFFPARGSHRHLERHLDRHGTTHDVYVGCALRKAQRGDRDHVGQVWTLWAECDGPRSRRGLDAFVSPPSLLIASGTPGNVHAYWALADAIDADTAESANRRLATAVGGDPVCYDAARILRPPGTRNHKHKPALAVRQIGPSHRQPYRLAELVAGLPPGVPLAPGAAALRIISADPLLSIEPARYIPELTGLALGRDSKVSCPFHEDRTPSLHVFATAERGWFCFGCGRGGSIYDLAASLWGLQTRGGEFVELRERLTRALL